MTFDELAEKLEKDPSKRFGRGATEAEITECSARLGVPLEGQYRRFLQRFGWGGVGDFKLFGLGRDVPPYLNLTAVTTCERTEAHPNIPHHLVPIFNDGGGNHYCLDSSVRGEPPVVFWDHELDEEQTPDHVASDFLSWLISYVEEIPKDEE